MMLYDVKNREGDVAVNRDEIQSIIDYFRGQGAPGDQQMLIQMLREAQDADGGMLSQNTLGMIRDTCGIKEAMLNALIRRIPALRCETVPHKLEVCGTCRAGAALRNAIESEYGVRSGGCNEEAGFSYRVTGCMKNCKRGPSVRWDGTLYPCATIEMLKELIGR